MVRYWRWQCISVALWHKLFSAILISAVSHYKVKLMTTQSSKVCEGSKTNNAMTSLAVTILTLTILSLVWLKNWVLLFDELVTLVSLLFGVRYFSHINKIINERYASDPEAARFPGRAVMVMSAVCLLATLPFYSDVAIYQGASLPVVLHAIKHAIMHWK